MQGYHAFVPVPLPPDIHYQVELVLLLSRADAALSKLSGLGRTLPNAHLLIAQYVWREAVLSSRINDAGAPVMGGLQAPAVREQQYPLARDGHGYRISSGNPSPCGRAASVPQQS